jgi:mono/diheme cytochrome c family protein
VRGEESGRTAWKQKTPVRVSTPSHYLRRVGRERTGLSSGRQGLRPALAVCLVAAALVLTGCQSSVNVTGAKVDLRLPPQEDVEIPVVSDENEQPIIPDAVTGKQVFDANCAVCHGATGDGKGPMAPTLLAPDKDVYTALLGLFGIEPHRPPLPSKPVDFHNRDLENVITPAIMYETVTGGRPHTAMPAFGPEASFGANKAQTLTNQERWDANAYEMTFRTSPEELSAAQALYTQQCGVCHGANGDGKGGARSAEISQRLWSWARGEGPGIFTDINHIVQRNPSELSNAILDGHGLMPGYRGKLTTEQINGLVDYIYTFFYKHPPIK